MVTREMAWGKLHEMLDNRNLVKHCIAVEAAMAWYARRFEIPEHEREQWAVAGLIHDADWERFPDKHPGVIVDWLREKGASEDMINAVEAHGFEFGVEPTCLMARTLRAVDELTGLITAVALVKGKDILAVDVRSVVKKWPKKEFAAGVKRDDIERGARELEIDLEEHIGNVLTAMQQVKESLEL